MEKGTNVNMDKEKGIAFTNDGDDMDDQEINMLEEYFKSCPHPNISQRKKLSMELGLDPDDIKLWFQNKRSELKVEKERVSNIALKAENHELAEALKSVKCEACRMQGLREENASLKNEIERVKCMINDYMKEKKDEAISSSDVSHSAAEAAAKPDEGEASKRKDETS